MGRIALSVIALTALVACGGSAASTGPKALEYGSCSADATAGEASFIQAHGAHDARQLDPSVVAWDFGDGYWVIWHGENSQCAEDHATP